MQEDEPERLTAKTVRMFLAEHDLQLQEFAQVAGRSPHHLCEVLHGRRGLGPGLSERCKAAMAQIERSVATRGE